MSRTILAALGLLALIAGLVGAQGQPQMPPPWQPQPPQPPPQRPQRPPDPMAESLFPPELLMRNAQEIGLTDEQKESLKSEIQKAQARFPVLQQQVQKEQQAMADLVKEERPDAEKVLAQFDNVLAVEREMKRTYMALLIAIKNRLTPAQQTQLQELKPKPAAAAPPPAPEGVPPGSLQEKMQQVQARVKEWQAAGRDPAPVIRIMREFESLMKDRKFIDAEAVLDRALGLLGEEQK